MAVVTLTPMPFAPLAFAAVGSALAAHHLRATKRAGLAITRHTIPWPSLGRTVRVAQLTDIHVGLTTPRRALARAAETVHSLECDVVVLTGDYVNASLSHLGRVTEFVAALPQPLVAVLGNHDHWTHASRITSALEGGGAEVLRNARTTARGDGWALDIVGVDDGASRHDDVDLAFAGARDPSQALVLTHDPRTAPKIARYGSPLVLAGHTHAGQIHVPRIWPAVARLAGHPYLRGFHRFERTDLYVNAGVGHSLQGLRSAQTAPELAVFDLDPNARDRCSFAERTTLD